MKSAALAHDHAVRATAYGGQIQADPADPTTAAIVVEVQTASLKADEPAVRQKYGLTTPLSEKERQEIQTTMEAKTQLDVEQYPFTQSSFGYQPYSAFLGAVRNQDEVVLHFDIVATP